jgi:hypothetical protein
MQEKYQLNPARYLPVETHHSTNNTEATTPASTAFGLMVTVKDSILHADTTAESCISAQAEK